MMISWLICTKESSRKRDSSEPQLKTKQSKSPFLNFQRMTLQPFIPEGLNQIRIKRMPPLRKRRKVLTIKKTKNIRKYFQSPKEDSPNISRKTHFYPRSISILSIDPLNICNSWYLSKFFIFCSFKKID